MRCLAVFCLLLASFSTAVAEMSHEETVVRTAYAKLSYAVDLNTVYRVTQRNRKISASDLAREIENRALRFTLSDFEVGNLADIGDRKYLDLAGQYPDGQDVIHSYPATVNMTEGGPTITSDTAAAQWGPGQNAVSPVLTVKAMLPIMEQESGISPLVRYCSYTVTVSLGGRSRTYKATFLFGGNNQVAAGDTVVDINGGALEYFLTHPVYPDVLLRTTLRKNPAVRGFLESNRGTADASCKQGDICCDALSLQCGLPAAEARREP